MISQLLYMVLFCLGYTITFMILIGIARGQLKESPLAVFGVVWLFSCLWPVLWAVLILAILWKMVLSLFGLGKRKL